MSFKQFEPKDIKKIPKSCKCKENVNCNTVVISVVTMFNYLFQKCKNEQLDLFGLSKSYRTKCYIYLNNFNIMIDTVFRMLYKVGKYFDSIMKKTNTKNIILIDDLNVKYSNNIIDNMKQNANVICPKKWKMYNMLMKGFYSEKYIYKQLIWKLKSLSKYLDEDEYEDYDCWEILLSQKFPESYDFSLRSRPMKSSNLSDKNRILFQFLYLISLIQMQLTQYEIYMCWKFVLRQIRKNKKKYISVYECENGSFDYNIVYMFSNQRTVFITDKYVNVDNIFFYNNKNKSFYYPCSFKGCILKDVPNDSVKLIKRVKRNKEISKPLDLFDVCESECNGKILDINSAYTLSVFSNLRNLYVNKIFDELMPDKIDEREYSWIMKEFYIDPIYEWVHSFNKLSKFKIHNE